MATQKDPTNKERIERMEKAIGEVQDGMAELSVGMGDRLRRLEENLQTLSEITLSTKISLHKPDREEGSCIRKEKDEGESHWRPFTPRLVKVEFPRYAGDDPTEWFNRVSQFFDYQETAENQKVSLASFHLEGEANQWWQWLSRSYKEEARVITWEIFVEELWARFGPTDCEDFDEALSHVRQLGSLRDYQREFEKLGNRVQGWTQKALVGTFMGGLKAEISEGIRMFKPKTLKEAISLARMRDEQLQRQQKLAEPPPQPRTPLDLSTESPTVSPIKKLSWEEMQRRRAHGLCFHCDEKFIAGHKCRAARLLLLEGHADGSGLRCEELVEDDDAATWGNTRQLQERFPFADLADKVPLKGGGIDKNQQQRKS